MVDHLASNYALGREDAYLLCSLAVDLKISEIVDAGQYIVSALLPEAIFSQLRAVRSAQHRHVGDDLVAAVGDQDVVLDADPAEAEHAVDESQSTSSRYRRRRSGSCRIAGTK